MQMTGFEMIWSRERKASQNRANPEDPMTLVRRRKNPMNAEKTEQVPRPEVPRLNVNRLSAAVGDDYMAYVCFRLTKKTERLHVLQQDSSLFAQLLRDDKT